MTYYALLLPIMCMIWSDCVSENEKKKSMTEQYQIDWGTHG